MGARHAAGRKQRVYGSRQQLSLCFCEIKIVERQDDYVDVVNIL